MLIKYKLIHFDDLVLKNRDLCAIWAFSSSIDEHLTELTNEPASKLNHTHLVDVFLHGKVDL